MSATDALTNFLDEPSPPKEGGQTPLEALARIDTKVSEITKTLCEDNFAKAAIELDDLVFSVVCLKSACHQIAQVIARELK